MPRPTRPDGALLHRARALPASDLTDLAGEGGVLVIAPHPGDETLGCGAAIMAALADGRPVTVALLTSGEMTHPSSRTHPPRAMERLRQREFAEALARLESAAGGVSIARIILDLTHTEVPHDVDALAPIAERIAETARRGGVEAIWCTWGGDEHKDHVAAARLADLVEADLAGHGTRPLRRDYPIWGRFRDALPEEEILTFPLGEWQRAKAHAMVAYTSQLTHMVRDVPDGFVVPPAFTAHFATAPEIFLAPERRSGH